ncbi:hypothetical protein [uncultured Devosia sp.]|uniref:hypothetical protein n=1 Tax=uncultured Devosia sp. TaxID=211434 RepID=UPI0030ED1008|tara:strand:+ start:4377 stop:5219 length:843 start_codon:yes stop_codon:yes gene_type:complete
MIGFTIVAAIAVAFLLRLGAFVRIGILLVGIGLAIAGTQNGRDLSNLVGLAIGVVPNPNVAGGDSLQPPNTSDQVTTTYRVTATVRVNGEVRTGASVQRVLIRRNITFGSNQLLNTITRFFGEAVAIPIVDDEYLLITMSDAPGNRPYEELMASPCQNIFVYDGSERPTAGAVLANATKFTGPCDVSVDRLPAMLAVSTSLEPVGFEFVSPSTLTEVFGVPVEFVSLSFSRTNSSLEFVLAEVFPWIEARSSGGVSMPIKLKENEHVSTFYKSAITRGSN